MEKGKSCHVGLTRQGDLFEHLFVCRGSHLMGHRKLSGNSKVCVESYPQVYPQAVDKVVHNLSTSPPGYPQGREIVCLSGNPHLILR